jgi:hypothetical protein
LFNAGLFGQMGVYPSPFVATSIALPDTALGISGLWYQSTSKVILEFSRAMNTAVLPGDSDFVLKVNGSPISDVVNPVSWLDTTHLSLTFDYNVGSGTWTLDYEAQGARIQEADSTPVDDFDDLVLAIP